MTSINVQLLEVEALIFMFPNVEFELSLSSSEMINEAGKKKKKQETAAEFYIQYFWTVLQSLIFIK